MMGKYIKVFGALVIMAVLAGCAGGVKTSPVEESMTADTDTTGVFIFAETPIINIDSEFMAERLSSQRVGGQNIVIDSITSLNTVYSILLDSILGQDAADYDLAKEDPVMYRQYMKLRYDRVMRAMYQEVIVEPVTVSDSAVKAAYEEDKETFLIPEMYRARHIVIAGDGLKRGDDSLEYMGMSDETLDSLAHSQIAKIHQRLLNGENFDTLAMLYSQDQNTSDLGGDLGYFQLVQMISPFDSTVEFTPVGDISNIIKTEYGWHVIKVEDHSLEHYRPLDSVYTQVENKIKEQLIIEKSRQFIDSLVESATIIFDTAAIMVEDSLFQDDDVLAYVNPEDEESGNDTLYGSDYLENVYAYKRHKQIEGELSLDDKIELLKGISVRYLLVQTARKLGYYNLPEIEEWAQHTVKKYSISNMRKTIKQDDYEPTKEELQAYYESNIHDYQVERPLTVQHIVFADSNLAEHVRDLLMSGLDFMEMVDQYYPGDPDIRRAAADLGELGPDDMPREFYNVAMRTPVNTISYPVKTEYGYHLIKVLKKAHSIEFDHAKVKIKPILKKAHLDEKIRNYVDSRLKKPPVIHWDKLDKLHFKGRVPVDFSQFRKVP